MRSVLLLAPALLVACTTAPAHTADPVDAPPAEEAGGPPQPIIHGETPGHTCNAAGTERYIGQVGDSATGAAIKRETNSAQLRWAPPGYMMTMEYSANRVTIWLDDQRKITKISCG